MGSMLALEWAATFPDFVEKLILIAGCGRHTDWAIAIGEAERFAVYADARFKGGAYDPSDPPNAGLAAARMKPPTSRALPSASATSISSWRAASSKNVPSRGSRVRWQRQLI